MVETLTVEQRKQSTIGQIIAAFEAAGYYKSRTQYHNQSQNATVNLFRETSDLPYPRFHLMLSVLNGPIPLSISSIHLDLRRHRTAYVSGRERHEEIKRLITFMQTHKDTPVELVYVLNSQLLFGEAGELNHFRQATGHQLGQRYLADVRAGKIRRGQRRIIEARRHQWLRRGNRVDPRDLASEY